MGLVRDVTSQRQTEVALARERDFVRVVLDTSNALIAANSDRMKTSQAIRINPREAEVPGHGISLEMGALAALREIEKQLPGCRLSAK